MIRCAALLLLAAAAAGGVTERGRSLDAALDLLLAEGQARSADTRADRLVVFLIDATPSLKRSRFADKFRAALDRNAEKLRSTRLAVVPVGAVGKFGFKAGPTLLANTVEDLLDKPKQVLHNVYADVRKVARALAGKNARREIVLVTLENGDAEDDLEATISALRRAKVKLSVIAREAFLSDSYWKGHYYETRARLEYTGGDSAFIELPWGWLLQRSTANESVPSGYAMYGLTRMVAETDGRAFLHYPDTIATHECTDNAYHAVCAFCDDDHRPAGEAYRAVRLDALAPLFLPRRQVLAAAQGDPFFQATQRAWEAAAKLGVVRAPPYRLSGTGLKENRGGLSGMSMYPLKFSRRFDREAHNARKLLVKLAPIQAGLERDLEHARTAGGSRRWQAVAEYTHVMLKVTRVNLLLLIEFCKNVTPRHEFPRPKDYVPPEVPMYVLDAALRERIVGFYYYSLSLCHGVKPFAELRLPGLRPELDALAASVEGYLARYAHTPFAMALRRAGLTSYYLTVEGKPIKWKRRIRSSKKEETETEKERERPTREGTTAGQPDGPTSGGG